MDQYLTNVIKQFLYYKLLGEKAINQLKAPQLFIKHNEHSNSIAVIIKHMSGNMLSRWTDFLTTDGEKPGRNRDLEFTEEIHSKEELFEIWEAGWSCLFNTLNTLEKNDLSSIIYIRNEGHTVLEAINRQLSHYPYHVGQIVFYAKQLVNNEWENLSIPKNKSVQYNTLKFEKEKTIKNFTDEEIKGLL